MACTRAGREVRAASVELTPPVFGHETSGPGHGLVERVVPWRGELGTLRIGLGRVVPEPVLAGLIALDDRVPFSHRVTAGVLRGRRVATPDVPASGTAAQVEPPPVGRQALDAARTARRDVPIDQDTVVHGTILPRLATSRRRPVQAGRCGSLSGMNHRGERPSHAIPAVRRRHADGQKVALDAVRAVLMGCAG
jgi:hypothetical protein